MRGGICRPRTIILNDARTWHRARVNLTAKERGAMIQAIVPGYVMSFMDTSKTFESLLKSAHYGEMTARERKELDKLHDYASIRSAAVVVPEIGG